MIQAKHRLISKHPNILKNLPVRQNVKKKEILFLPEDNYPIWYQNLKKRGVIR